MNHSLVHVVAVEEATSNFLNRFNVDYSHDSTQNVAAPIDDVQERTFVTEGIEACMAICIDNEEIHD